MLTARGPPRLGQGSEVSESGLHTGRATESGVGQPLRGARTQRRLGLDLFDTTGGNGCHSYIKVPILILCVHTQTRPALNES